MAITTAADHSGDVPSYAGTRVIHDADAHLSEPNGFYEAYADPADRARLAELEVGSKGRDMTPVHEKYLGRHNSAERVAAEATEVLLHKNIEALGAFDSSDRVRALDHLGFQSQLMFTTSFLRVLTDTDRDGDRSLALAATRAHNRAMVDFCSADDRLLPVCWVPFGSIDDALVIGREAIAAGAAALMIPSICPRTHSPSHIGFEPLWAMAAEAGVPIVFHVGGGRAMVESYKADGRPPVKDFLGGDGNFTSISFMAIPEAPMQTLAALILQGVMERYPTLRFGVIEQGAYWVPGWMRSMDSAAGAFRKNEERLTKLSLKPSEYVERQVRVTPYPHEDAGWIIDQVGPTIAMFSSDYPHVEGGRNPLKRFDETLVGQSAEAVDGFYANNFADLMRLG